MKKIVSFKNKTFRYIYKNGKSFGNRSLVIYYMKNGYDYGRLGITTSKKLGNSVKRNHIKRLIKESYIKNFYRLKKGYDIIIIAKIPCQNHCFNEVDSAFKHIIKKVGLVEK